MRIRKTENEDSWVVTAHTEMEKQFFEWLFLSLRFGVTDAQRPPDKTGIVQRFIDLGSLEE